MAASVGGRDRTQQMASNHPLSAYAAPRAINRDGLITLIGRKRETTAKAARLLPKNQAGVTPGPLKIWGLYT